MKYIWFRMYANNIKNIHTHRRYWGRYPAEFRTLGVYDHQFKSGCRRRYYMGKVPRGALKPPKSKTSSSTLGNTACDTGEGTPQGFEHLGSMTTSSSLGIADIKSFVWLKYHMNTLPIVLWNGRVVIICFQKLNKLTAKKNLIIKECLL